MNSANWASVYSELVFRGWPGCRSHWACQWKQPGAPEFDQKSQQRTPDTLGMVQHCGFVLPAENTFGSAGRNVVIGPGLANLDISFQKEATLRETLKVQFRGDVYNILNHPNFDLPGRIFGASNFGVITSAEDPREFQFAMKLMF